MEKDRKEEIKEIFEVSKGKEEQIPGLYSKESKDKIIEKEGKEKVPLIKKGQDEHQNKVLRNIIIGIILVFAIVVGIYYYTQSQIYFDYKGVEFTTVSEGQLIFYKTSIPVNNKGSIVPYNFFLRTKPTKLEDVPFEVDSFTLMKNVVINQEEPFNCDGDGVIAIANLARLHQVMGINFFKDENATCDDSGRYGYLTLKSGGETKITQIGNNCYDIIINNCEILPATEKLMAEMFVDFYKQ